jgi:hypothetical protein
MADAFSAIGPILPYLVIGFIAFYLFIKFLAAFGAYIPWLSRRKLRVKQHVRDYDGEFILDLKRGAVRNKVKAKRLHVRDPNDPEFPYMFYGKIKGVNADSDVYEIVVARKLGILSDPLFINKELVTDLNSRDLYAECHGWKPKARWFWLPIWGASVPRDLQEKRNRAIWVHIASEYDIFRSFISREQGTANLEKSMTSSPRDLLARLTGPEYVNAPQNEGEEEIH